MPIEKVEVSVALIACGPSMLAIFNRTWGAFSLPMTKRRQWQDLGLGLPMKDEEYQTAAVRAAAEVLGRTLSDEELPVFLHEIKEFRQSDADGVWKLYDFHVFRMALDAKPDALGWGVVVEWLSEKDFTTRRPVSKTAAVILKNLADEKKLPPWA